MNDHRPIIIKLGGLAVEDPARATPLLRSIAEAARSLPIILVHGGGKAVDDHLARLGIPTSRVQGLRVTTDAEIHEVIAVLAGKVNTCIVGALLALGAKPVGLTLSDGDTARAQIYVPSSPGGSPPPDLGRVGVISSGNPAFVDLLLRNNYLPVLAPIAFDHVGMPLNINADDAASGVAAIVGARLLILLTDVPGVLDAEKKPIDALDAAAAEHLIETGVIVGGMIPKVRSALAAADHARAPAVIASWNQPESLAALLRNEHRGTRFLPTPAPASC